MSVVNGSVYVTQITAVYRGTTQVFAFDENTGEPQPSSSPQTNQSPSNSSILTENPTPDLIYEANALATNFIAEARQAKTVTAAAYSQFLIDSQNQKAYFGFTVTLQAIGGVNGLNQYVGALWCVDLTTNRTLWTTTIVDNGVSGVPGLTLFKDTIYLTTGNDLWAINESTGKVFGMQNSSGVLQPVVADNKMFVISNFRLTAYE